MKPIYTYVRIAVMAIGLLIMGCGIPPTYPINATDGEGSSVTVTWEEWAHGTPATTFDIWRSDAPNGAYTEVATGVTSPFSDDPGSDRVYFYKVEAADTEVSGYDAGFYGDTSGNTALDYLTEGPKWMAVLENLDTQFRDQYGSDLDPDVYNLNCDGGGTETVTVTEPSGLLRLDIIFSGCKDAASGETLNGIEELVVNESLQGYLRGQLDYDEGSLYMNTALAAPDAVFVTDGPWGADTEFVMIPEE